VIKNDETLSGSLYQVIVTYEQDDDGRAFYLAVNPEIEGAMAQGDTVDEAEANLADVRQMVIEHLIANGLPVPMPMPLNSLIDQAQTLVIGRIEPISQQAPSVQLYRIDNQVLEMAS
jgi:predicted RNase H-like HicB family nuclease